MTDDIESQEYVEEEENPRDLRSQLKERNKAIEAAEKRARNAELKVAMAESGVPLDPRTKFFFNNYDGDTDPEVVKAALIEHGFLDAGEEVPSGEGEAHQEISEAAAGAAPQTPPGSEQYMQELEELGKKWVPGMDSQRLIDEGTAIMRKYGQRVSTDSPGALPD